MMRKKKIIGSVLVIIGIFLVIYKLAGYREAKREYRNLDENYVIDIEDEAAYGAQLYVDIDALEEENSDFVGWIYVDGVLSYPVVCGEDNEYYLHHSFQKEYKSSGCIFMDARNEYNWKNPNVILYGHNMKNGEMFGCLKKYKEQKFYERHKEIQVYTVDYRILTYEILSVKIVDANAENYQTIFMEKNMWEFLEAMQKDAMYETDLLDCVGERDKYLTLSTCTGDKEKRLVVHAMLINEEAYKP